MRPSLRAAVATAAFSILLIPQLAAADNATPDGDTGAPSGNLSYGADDCDDMGTPVAGAVVVKHAGSTHFTPGESVTISYTPIGAGISVATTGVVPNVPSDWNDSSDEFTITYNTTVAAGSAGGSVEMNIVGGTSGHVAGTTGSGRPKFNVNVHSDCVVSVPTDNTPPTISLDTGAPDGDNGWYVTSPVTVTYTANDDTGVTGVSCTDNAGTPFAVTGGAFTVSGDGIHNLSCIASDAAGNNSPPATGQVKIDTVNPGISGPTRSPANPAGTDNLLVDWFNTDVVYTWTCSDVTSGPVNPTDVQTLSAENVDRDTGSVATGTCTDNAGNTSSADSDVTNIDKAAPDLNITGAPSGAYDVCTAPARPTSAPTDALSGVNPSTVSDSWTTPGPVGTWTYNAQADDYATNHAEETRTYNVTYGAAYSGVLAPINPDGTSKYKLGQTIPVKFKLACNGVPITDAVARLRVSQGDNKPDPGESEAGSTSAATEGNLFRYDASAGQYIFNLSTKAGLFKNPDGTPVTFAQGTWTLHINLGDGVSRQVIIQITK
jgi:hypothetical protein